MFFFCCSTNCLVVSIGYIVYTTTEVDKILRCVAPRTSVAKVVKCCKSVWKTRIHVVCWIFSQRAFRVHFVARELRYVYTLRLIGPISYLGACYIRVRRQQNAFMRKWRCALTAFLGEPLNHIYQDTKSARLIAVCKRSFKYEMWDISKPACR